MVLIHLPAERRCQEALGELLGAEALPLEELDRQGRRRRRDLRPLLLDLHWHHWSPQRLELGLETLVQANGRSLKPDQLRQLWRNASAVSCSKRSCGAWR